MQLSPCRTQQMDFTDTPIHPSHYDISVPPIIMHAVVDRQKAYNKTTRDANTAVFYYIQKVMCV